MNKKKLNTKLAGELYREGASDADISKGCGVSVETVRNWRKRCGLLSNYEKKSESQLTQLERDAIAARKAGLNYGVWKAQQHSGGN